LAANNGDTLGEAVISVKVMNSDQTVKKDFQHKTASRKTVLHHHHLSFFSFLAEFLKDVN
jgi:hypothetical protein